MYKKLHLLTTRRSFIPPSACSVSIEQVRGTRRFGRYFNTSVPPPVRMRRPNGRTLPLLLGSELIGSELIRETDLTARG